VVSSHRAWAEAVVALLLAGCDVGAGEGRATGVVNAPACGLVNASYELEPTFFGGDDAVGQFEIRIQRGSDLENLSDGLLLLVRDPSEVRNEWPSVPIEVTGDARDLVQVSFYLNESCRPSRSSAPVHLEAIAGTITFTAIYAPEVSDDDVETNARFDALRFVDPSDPDTNSAELSGEFRFLFTRGRPAQRFP
jgi:hypothetical protein